MTHKDQDTRMATATVTQAPADPASAQAFSGPIGAEYEMLKLICPAAADMSRQVGALLAGWQQPGTGAERPLKVLEIGCGTGITTAALLHARADTEITAVDIAAPMLAQAKGNLTAWSDAGRLYFVETDALCFVKGLPMDSVDVVASGYAFHNFLDDYRCEIVREVHRVLCPGGVLINGDRYALDDSIEQTRVIQDELRQYFRVFAELKRPDLLEDWTLHLFSDEAPEHVMRLEPALALYRDVGFDPVRVLERYDNNAVVSAEKPRA
jgi:ubiquinone/menaquinone biosynthesis C-methylase UbiE